MDQGRRRRRLPRRGAEHSQFLAGRPGRDQPGRHVLPSLQHPSSVRDAPWWRGSASYPVPLRLPRLRRTTVQPAAVGASGRHGRFAAAGSGALDHRPLQGGADGGQGAPGGLGDDPRQAQRAHVCRGAARTYRAAARGVPGWLAGLRDPQVGAALRLIHGRPAEPWTLDQLVARSGSRDPSLRADFPPTWAFRPCSTLPAGACSSRSATSRTPWSASPKPGPKSATSPRPRSTGPSRKSSASRPAPGGAAGPGRTGLCRLHPPSQRAFDVPARLPICPAPTPAQGQFCAGVAELVDALDLGSSAARRGGSSPLTRTTAHRHAPANALGHQRYPNGTTPMQVTETLNEGLKRKLSVTIPSRT